MGILEKTILVSKVEIDDGKFNILEYHTRKFIEKTKQVDTNGKFNLFEIRFRAIPGQPEGETCQHDYLPTYWGDECRRCLMGRDGKKLNKSQPGKGESVTFEEELVDLINRYSKENSSNTPDFILARYLTDCLAGFETATKNREKWFGRDPMLPPAFFNLPGPEGKK